MTAFRVNVVFIAIILIMSALALFAVMIWAIVTTTNSGNDDLRCTVDPVGIRLLYEYGNATNAYQFVVDFNVTTMQANYVFYLLSSAANPNVVIQDDPYRIDRLTPTDYSNITYNMMLLAPFANTPGNILAVMNNVIPATRPIIDAWRGVIYALMDKFARKLIFTGATYNIDHYIMSGLGNRLYIPIGFFYVVFDTTSVPTIASEVSGDILDYSYYSVRDFMLINVNARPYWFTCQ